MGTEKWRPTRPYTRADGLNMPTSSTDNKGSVNRNESLLTNVAAVVTQVLPKGSLKG